MGAARLGPVEVGLLGPVQVTVGDQVSEVRGDRLRALLARLALDVGRPVTVTTLVASLWDADEVGGEVNALQSLVSRLRRSQPEPAVLESVAAGYRLALVEDEVDALRFERLARTGRDLLAAGDPLAARATLQEALGLWRGDPLADVGQAPFAPVEAQRLAEVRLSATEDLVEARLSIGEAGDVVLDAEVMAAAHPLRERTRLLHLQALRATGRPAEALAAYETFRRTLAEELGADPSAGLQALHLELLQGDTASGPGSGRGRGERRSHAPLTSFIGREEEMDALSVRIAEHRLVTLVGPGGAGKTRLAAETAERLDASFPGGTWFATLAPLDDPRDLAHAVVGMLGLHERGLTSAGAAVASTRDARSRLLEVFGSAPALLVLDNCEHLVEAAASLADDLLASCPKLHVLATSREPLGIVGEELAPLLPLQRPAAGSTLDEALRTASVQLFAERAAAVSPGFVVDATTVDAVVEICRRLDGLPLAIELAAARLRSMGVGQVAARLDDRFRLLTGGSRTALPRHRTLRAVVAWSWDLLDAHERALAERIAVFPGGVTPESASAVTGIAPEEVLDVLGALAEKSLLHVADPEEPRYRMLETIREFGVEQLAARDELAAARRAHSTWAVELAERADPMVSTRDQLPWIRLLTAERDNLSTALRFAVDTDDVDTAARLTAALSAFWMLQSNHDEGLAWASAVCAMPGTAPPLARAVVLAVRNFSLAMMDFGNDPDVARALDAPAMAEMEDAIEAAGGLQAHRILAFARPILAMSERDDAAAVRLLEEGLEGTSDPWTRATLTFLRGMIMQNRGDQAALERDLRSAREQFANVGDRWGWAMTEFASAELHTFSDDVDAALAELTTAASLMTEIGATEDIVQALVRRSTLQAQLGRIEEAEATMAEASAIVGRSPLPRLTTSIAIGRAAIAVEAHDDDLAERLLHESLDRTGPTIGAMYYQAAAFTMLGFVGARRGDLTAARDHLRKAYARAEHVQDMPIVAMTVVGWAYLRACEGEAPDAARLVGLASVVRGIDDRGPGLTRYVRERVVTQLGTEETERLVRETLTLDHAAALAEVTHAIGGGS
jgi:predicted ATPase/DNA-binding SARP family transcriptional activator